MATSYPNSLDTLTNPTSGQGMNSPSHSQQHADANDSIEALEAKVGVDGSAVTTSHDYLIRAKSFVATVGRTAADYLTDGTDDDVQIQAALDAANAAGGSRPITFGSSPSSPSCGLKSATGRRSATAATAGRATTTTA